MEFVCKKCGCTEYYECHERGVIRKRCKNCQQERMRLYYKTDKYKKKHRDDDRRRRRNCKPELYASLLQSQKGMCAICGKECNEKLRADHDHTSGKMRGLLCDTCNWGLGLFKDNTELLEKAINYLKKYQ
jgi:hypothetical protein